MQNKVCHILFFFFFFGLSLLTFKLSKISIESVRKIVNAHWTYLWQCITFYNNLHFYSEIINWNYIWNIDFNNGVYCDLHNKSSCLNTVQGNQKYWWNHHLHNQCHLKKKCFFYFTARNMHRRCRMLWKKIHNIGLTDRILKGSSARYGFTYVKSQKKKLQNFICILKIAVKLLRQLDLFKNTKAKCKVCTSKVNWNNEVPWYIQFTRYYSP